MNIQKREVLSSDGVHQLKGVVYMPDGEIKALVHVVHGMTEYIARYDELMRYLTQHGFLCFGYDHLGHGMTARDDSEFGFIAHKKGDERLVEDVLRFAGDIKKDYPGKKYILYGHSMGSFIVRLAALKQKPDALIISGTSGPNPTAGVGLLLADMISLFRTEKHVSPLLESMAFGNFNKGFLTEHNPYAWLTKDEEIKASYASDRLCTFHFTVSAMHDLIKLNKDSNSPAWFTGIDRDMPLLLFSGALDPVGENGKGVQAVFDRLQKAGKRNVQWKLYPNCRHEVHHEPEREQLFQDVLHFAEGIL